MNYQRIYDDLIAKRRVSPPVGYSERHHIVPRSMGGANHKDNIVILTAREHFVAHALLAKIHGGRQWTAVAMMRGKSEVSSRTYEIVRRAAAQSCSDRMRGKKLSEEHKQKLRGKVRTQAHSEAIASQTRGKKRGPMPASHRLALSKAKTGQVFTEQSRKKMSASAALAHSKRDKQDRVHGASLAASIRWERYRHEKRMKTVMFLSLLAGLVEHASASANSSQNKAA